MNMVAPTLDYNNPNLNDSEGNGGGRILVTDDGRVRTFDIQGISNQDFRQDPWWESYPIVSTPNDDMWRESDASPHVYQTHFVTSTVLPEFDNIGINIPNVTVGATNLPNGTYLDSSNPDNVYIGLGSLGEGNTFNSFALFDFAGHELAHAFLDPYLYDFGDEVNGLNEGFADIFGTYVESVVEGEVDWIICDNNQAAREDIDRDLANPNYDCYDILGELDYPHDRGEPIAHWFYLITEGDDFNIPALGINRAIEIVRDAIISMDTNQPSYLDFREAVEVLVDTRFGYCSDEGIAIRRAFGRICVGNEEACGYKVFVPAPVCEEYNALTLCVDENGLDHEYMWVFPTSWHVNGSDAYRYWGKCLSVHQFDTYFSYPRRFTVKLFNLTLDEEREYEIFIIDCDGDDPVCRNDDHLVEDADIYDESFENQRLQSSTYKTAIYNLQGQLIYSGTQASNNDYQLQNGLYIKVTLAPDGEVIETNKIVIFN